MRQLLAGLALVVSCSAEPQPGNNHAGSATITQAGDDRTQARDGPSSMTGLYESAGPQGTSQLCVIDDRFGILVWGSNLHSCSGSGRIERDGDRLRLRMSGDSPCVIEARISGTTVNLPDEAPTVCAYYCGARARLQGVQLRRTGGSRNDAMKARDLVGEALCEE